MAIESAISFRYINLNPTSSPRSAWAASKPSGGNDIKSIVRTIETDFQYQTAETQGADSDVITHTPLIKDFGTIKLTCEYDPSLHSYIDVFGGNGNGQVLEMAVARKSGQGGFDLTQVYLTKSTGSRDANGHLTFDVELMAAQGCKYNHSYSG